VGEHGGTAGAAENSRAGAGAARAVEGANRAKSCRALTGPSLGGRLVRGAEGSARAVRRRALPAVGGAGSAGAAGLLLRLRRGFAPRGLADRSAGRLRSSSADVAGERW